jgi:alkylation response protein AidB-like acyl-CoA dehydrogenase
VLNVELSDEQAAFAASVAAAIARHPLTGGPAPEALWLELGELGLLGIGTDHVGGTALDMVAAMRAAGAAGVQGPFIGTQLAIRLLPEIAEAAAAGRAHAAVIAGSIAAWTSGPTTADAAAALEFDPDGSVHLVEPIRVTPFASLAAEPWSRVTSDRGRRLSVDPLDLGFIELQRAAWMVGAGDTLLRLAAEHARDRVQFGKRIGDFQAVAHPLANAAAEVGAAGDLVLLAAHRLEAEADPGPASAAALAAGRAGLLAAFASHQAHGAIGFTAERGLDRLSAGIRQLSLHPPGVAGARELVLQRWTA